MNNNEVEFYDTIKNINGVLRVTIPAKLAEIYKFKEGNNVKIKILKI